MTDDSLQQLFVGKGFQVTAGRVIRDREGGRSRGFEFVELGAGSDVAKVIVDLNGFSVEGRVLQVNETRPQEARAGGHSSGGRDFSGGRSNGNGRRS